MNSRKTMKIKVLRCAVNKIIQTTNVKIQKQFMSFIVCVTCRDYRSDGQGDEGNRRKEFPFSRQKSEEGSLPPSQYNSRPPTRSGSRPSTADSLRHSIGGWSLSFTSQMKAVEYIFSNAFDPFKML